MQEAPRGSLSAPVDPLLAVVGVGAALATWATTVTRWHRGEHVTRAALGGLLRDLETCRDVLREVQLELDRRERRDSR